MIRNILEGRVQARILTAVTAAAVAIGGAILIPGVATAATTTASVSSETADTITLVTLTGVAENATAPGCIEFTTVDGSSYELLWPTHITPDMRDFMKQLYLTGIPLGVLMELQVMPVTGMASYCMVGPMVEVYGITVLS